MDAATRRQAEDRVRFLLGARRPTEALAACDGALAATPSDSGLHTLRAECHLALGNMSAADADIASAFALAPPTSATLGVATRVALCAGDLTTASARARMLRNADPLDPYAWYLTAIVAATNRDLSLCDQAVSTCVELGAGDRLGRCAGIEVAIILGGRRRLQRARADAERLIGDLPADGYARKLAAAATRRSGPFVRGGADDEIRHLAAGSALGARPEPGQLSEALRRAVDPTLIALSWGFVVVFGTQLVSSKGEVWWIPAPLAALWVVWTVTRARRSAKSIARLPAAGRRRLARPAIAASLLFGIAGIAVGAAVAAVMAPWDRQRAVELELGHDEHSTTRIVTRPPTTFPTFPTFPTAPMTMPGPIGERSRVTIPPLPPIPRTTLAPIPNTDIVTVDAPVDADTAWRMLKQITLSALATLAVAAAQVWAWVLQRRELR